MNQPVRLSSLCLLLIGAGDLLASVWWIKNGQAEGNPLFAWLSQYGLIVFVIGKLAFLAGPIAILEYARRSHPKSAEQGTWLAALLYLLFLALHMRQSGGP